MSSQDKKRNRHLAVLGCAALCVVSSGCESNAVCAADFWHAHKIGVSTDYDSGFPPGSYLFEVSGGGFNVVAPINIDTDGRLHLSPTQHFGRYTLYTERFAWKTDPATGAPYSYPLPEGAMEPDLDVLAISLETRVDDYPPQADLDVTVRYENEVVSFFTSQASYSERDTCQGVVSTSLSLQPFIEPM